MGKTGQWLPGEQHPILRFQGLNLRHTGRPCDVPGQWRLMLGRGLELLWMSWWLKWHRVGDQVNKPWKCCCSSCSNMATFWINDFWKVQLVTVLLRLKYHVYRCLNLPFLVLQCLVYLDVYFLQSMCHVFALYSFGFSFCICAHLQLDVISV